MFYNPKQKHTNNGMLSVRSSLLLGGSTLFERKVT
jgi:hypothetical protein